MPERDKDDERDGGARIRPFWSGTIAFGLVSVPVSLLVANRPAGISLRMVDADGTPLRRRYVCSRDGEYLEAEEIVRGYEVEDGHFLTIDDEELAALAPEKSREIDLKRFVPLDQIDPIYFDRAYFLVPERGAVKAYRLLARTMEQVGRAGIATSVMRGREYLVAIIGERGLLRAETLRFHDELRTPADLGLSEVGESDARQVRETVKAIRGLAAGTLDRELLEDRQRQRLQALIQHKLEAGADIIAAPDTEEDEEEQRETAEVVDLMAVLKRSLRAGGAPSKRQHATSRRDADRDPAPAALAERSKAELYRRAQALGIEGRSQMNKQELIEAIRAR